MQLFFSKVQNFQDIFYPCDSHGQHAKCKDWIEMDLLVPFYFPTVDGFTYSARALFCRQTSLFRHGVLRELNV